MNQSIEKKYNLKDFSEIIAAIIEWTGDWEKLNGKRILELGPGAKLNLFNFLKDEFASTQVRAAGKTINSKDGLVEDSFLLPFLEKQPAQFFDLIYSRHVFEANSFHPLLLITHPAYWKAIINNRMQNPGISFPSSISNMQAIFKKAYRTLKPGGIIISQIAKRRYSALTESFLQSLKPKPASFSIKESGRFGLLIKVLK